MSQVIPDDPDYFDPHMGGLRISASQLRNSRICCGLFSCGVLVALFLIIGVPIIVWKTA